MLTLGAASLVGPLAAPAGAQAGVQVEAIDGDGDGRISRRELVAFRNARFTELDANGDGQLHPDDFPAARRSQSLTALVGRLIANADMNRDGAVSSFEISMAGMPLFDRADSNGDGSIDQSEIARLRTLLNRQR